MQDVHIPLFGNTGAGKSTLLNATLRQEVVPTSGWRACTAVPVELKAGSSNDAFRQTPDAFRRELFEARRTPSLPTLEQCLASLELRRTGGPARSCTCTVKFQFGNHAKVWCMLKGDEKKMREIKKKACSERLLDW